jgi:hypothetical protein|tara:strand:+ start:682 stop:1200 length:519 start_codon:yes stop_codon:yes gene_type:complete
VEERYYDQFNVAPPGHSLTEDNSKWPWGRPSEMADPDEALDRAIESIMQPKTKQELFKLLMVGVSVEVLVEGMLFQGFRDGKYTPDVGLLIKGPLGIVIADMAEEEGIPYRLFENDDVLEKGEMDDETFFRMMKDNNPQMFSYIRENVNASIRAGNTPQEPNFMTMEREKEE